MGVRDSTFYKVRTFHRCHTLVKLLPCILSGFRCDAPQTVDLEITNKCNLHCQMCWFYGERGIGDRYRDAELSPHEVFSLIDQLSKYKPKIYIGGSEPFLRKDLFVILEYIKQQGLIVECATNGTLLDHGKIGFRVKPGMTNKEKEFMTHYTSSRMAWSHAPTAGLLSERSEGPQV